MRPSRAPAPVRFDRVAAVVQRVAVLLAAGIAPESAWRQVATDAEPGTTARAMAGADPGGDLSELMVTAGASSPGERVVWAALAAAWSVAAQAGAPLAPTLGRFAEVLRSLEQSAREVELALAGPSATARIVVALPPLGLLVGMVIGMNTLGVLFTTPVGLVCLAGGVGLMFGARRWNARLIASARQTDPTPGLALELLAIALSGGASPGRATAQVDAALERAGIHPLDEAARDLIAFASAAGVPASSLLRAQADEERRIADAAGRRRAVELGTRLLLPLGVCVLPAFVVLGVVPVVIALVSTTVSAW